MALQDPYCFSFAINFFKNLVQTAEWSRAGVWVMQFASSPAFEPLCESKPFAEYNRWLAEPPNFYVISKGQLILKWFFGVVDFLQKTNENKSTWGIIEVKSNSFIHFLEEINDPKKPFRNYLNFVNMYWGSRKLNSE